MFIPKSISKIELREDSLVIDSKNFYYGKLTEDDKEILAAMISKGSKYLPLLYLNNKYILESIDGKKLNKVEYLSYLLECKRIKKAGVKESNTKIRPLTNIGNLEILEGDKCIYFGKEGKIFTESSNYEELRKYRINNDDDLIVIRKNGEVIAKGMVDNLKDNWDRFKDFIFDEETKKYVCEYNGDTYTIEKIIVESIKEGVRTYNLLGDIVKLDINNKVININGKDITFKRMDEIVRDTKNVNRIHKPVALLLYTDYKNGKLKKYDNYLVEEAKYPDKTVVDDLKLNAEEEEELNSLYDREIKGYICPNCGKKIPNILDWNRVFYKGWGTEYYCPYCGVNFSATEVRDTAVFKESWWEENGEKPVYTKDDYDHGKIDWESSVKDAYNNVNMKGDYPTIDEIQEYLENIGVTHDNTAEEAAETNNAIKATLKGLNFKYLDESAEDGVIMSCPMCNKTCMLSLSTKDANKVLDYQEGRLSGLIQDLFPNLNPVEREFIKTGYCPDCQELLFDTGISSDRIKEYIFEGDGTQVGDIAPKEDYIEPIVKPDEKAKKKAVDESVEENFKDMVMELHSYVDADPERISSDLKDAIKNNKLDDYLKSKAAMSDEEVNDFKERYLKESTIEEPLKEDVANITDIEYVIPNYTGGGVYVYTGKLKDGNYFLGSDDWFSNDNPNFTIRVVDTDPNMCKDDECWFDDWQKEHLVKDLSEEENREITKQILHWIIENKSDGNYQVDDMKRLLDVAEPKKIEEAVNIPQGSEEACAYIFRKYRDEYDSINEVRWDQDRINELFDEGGMEKVNSEFFLPGASATYRRDYKLLIYPQNIEKHEKEKEAKRKEKEEKEKNKKPRKPFTVADIIDRLNKDLNKDNIGAYPPSGQGDNTIKVRKIDERFGLRFYVQMTYEEIPYDSFAISFNNVLSKKFADKVQPIIDLNRGTYTRRLGSERVFPEDFVFYIYKYDDVDKLAEVMKQILNEPTKVEESLKVGDKISFYSNGYKSNGKFSNKRDIKMNTEVTKVFDNGAVSAKDPQGVKSFDYISPEEIVSINGKNNPKLEYFAKVYYSHDNGDHNHKWTKKEIEDFVKDDIEMGNDILTLDSDTLNMLYQFQHELYKADRDDGLLEEFVLNKVNYQ